jgi:hypothetical protein
VIVVGVAERSRFASNPDGGLPIATTTIRIAEVLKRDATLAAGTQTLDLYQAGGPVPYPAPGGSLRELDIDELVLPGDQVVLFLTHQPRVSGFSALAGAGVYFVRAGRVTPEARNQFASTISGRSLPDVLAMIAAAAP